MASPPKPAVRSRSVQAMGWLVGGISLDSMRG
jgi:hypothetical protein